jgi:hypothetical protein
MGSVEVCAHCGTPVTPTGERVRIQGVLSHSRCWDRTQRRVRTGR